MKSYQYPPPLQLLVNRAGTPMNCSNTSPGSIVCGSLRHPTRPTGRRAGHRLTWWTIFVCDHGNSFDRMQLKSKGIHISYDDKNSFALVRFINHPRYNMFYMIFWNAPALISVNYQVQWPWVDGRLINIMPAISGTDLKCVNAPVLTVVPEKLYLLYMAMLNSSSVVPILL